MMLKYQRGFSLIELSMVMIIGGILLAGAISIGSAQLENARISSTQKKQEAIKTALINFMSRYKRLPCPSIATLSEGASGYGEEAAGEGVCTGTTRILGGAPRNVRGIVPWKALGLTDDEGQDAFYRRFTYQVLLSQTVSGVVGGAGITGNIEVRDAPNGNLLNLNNLAAAVIVSHGNDGLGAYQAVTGLRMPLGPASADDTRENTNNNLVYVQKDYSDVEDDRFDDTVMWLNPYEINAKLVDIGVILSPPLAVSQKLGGIRNVLIAAMAADNQDPDGAGSRILGRRVPFADCTGTPNGAADNNCQSGVVPWNSLGIAEALAKDPWDNFIKYDLTAALAADGVSLTTPVAGAAQITLTSSGVDGVQATSDDISLTIGIGELRGLLLAASVTFDNP